MILTSTDNIPGKKIIQTIGLARGNAIRARHIGKDIAAALQTIVGGEIKEYTKLMSEVREQAIDRMVDDGVRMGGNAVVCIRLSTSMVMQGAAEVIAYGTAVVIEDEDS